MEKIDKKFVILLLAILFVPFLSVHVMPATINFDFSFTDPEMGFPIRNYAQLYDRYDFSSGDESEFLEITRDDFPLATVTAYSGIDSCHYENCIMANGIRAEIGYIACPRSVDFGTTVAINGIFFTCGDRTAKRFDGRYDIFFGYGEEAHQKAIGFGVQKMEIYMPEIYMPERYMPER